MFGLYAAIKDHQRFLIFYSGVMSIVFLIQFITGIVGLSVKNDPKYSQYVAEALQKSFAPVPSAIGKFYEKKFECCGYKSFEDYKQAGNYSVPPSCCKTSGCDIANINGNLPNATSKDLIFEVGCKASLENNIRKVIEGACGILVTMSIFNLISIVLSVTLSRQIKDGYQFS